MNGYAREETRQKFQMRETLDGDSRVELTVYSIQAGVRAYVTRSLISIELAGLDLQVVRHKSRQKRSRKNNQRSAVWGVIISGTERNGGTHCDWPVDGIGHR